MTALQTDKPIALRVALRAATWAAVIHQRVPEPRLVSLTNHVVDLVSREEIYWWEPPDPDDEEECAEFTAFALATLRWIHQERAGRAPVPCYTRAKATAWVARRQQPVQLCLWNGMT